MTPKDRPAAFNPPEHEQALRNLAAGLVPVTVQHVRRRVEAIYDDGRVVVGPSGPVGFPYTRWLRRATP